MMSDIHLLAITAGDMASLTVAAGTFGLAAVTAWMAWSTQSMAKETKSSVDESKRQSDLAQASLLHTQEALNQAREATAISERQAQIALNTMRGSIQPVLVDREARDNEGSERLVFEGRSGPTVAPSLVYVNQGPDSDSSIDVRVPLRNIGRGIAIICGLGLRAGEVGWSGSMSSGFVPPDGCVNLTFSVPSDRADLKPLFDDYKAGTLLAEVSYSDLRGNIYTTQAHLRRRSPRKMAWHTRQVGIFEEGSDSPAVMSGPSDGPT